MAGSRISPVLAILAVLTLQFSRILILQNEPVAKVETTNSKHHLNPGNSTNHHVFLAGDRVHETTRYSDLNDWANKFEMVNSYPVFGVDSDQMKLLIISQFNYLMRANFASGNFLDGHGFFDDMEVAIRKCGSVTLAELVGDDYGSHTSKPTSAPTVSPTLSPTTQPTVAPTGTGRRAARSADDTAVAGSAVAHRDRRADTTISPDMESKCIGMLEYDALWGSSTIRDSQTSDGVKSASSTNSPGILHKNAPQDLADQTHISDSCITHMQFTAVMQHIFVSGLFFYLILILLANMFGFNENVHMILDFTTLFILLSAAVLSIVNIVSINYIVYHEDCIVQSIKSLHENLYDQTEAKDYSSSETGAAQASIAIDILTVVMVAFVTVSSLYFHGSILGKQQTIGDGAKEAFMSMF